MEPAGSEIHERQSSPNAWVTAVDMHGDMNNIHITPSQEVALLPMDAVNRM